MHCLNHSFPAALRRVLLALTAALCLLAVNLPQTATEAAVIPLLDTTKQVRVGVAVPGLGSGASSAEVSCTGGFTAGVPSADGRAFSGMQTVSASSLRIRTDGAGHISLLDGESGQTLYTHVSAEPLALKGAGGRPVTLRWDGKEREYAGFLEISTEGSALQVVNVVDTETYVKCVMGMEIGNNHPRETRRAFSVLVRTIPMRRKHASRGFDVCGTTCCQVYHGNERRTQENDDIVDSTAGEYVSYEGEPIHCFYHDGNGGASCSYAAAWGSSKNLPYLESVFFEDGEDADGWQHIFSKKELFDFLSTRDAFRGISGGIESVEIAETDPSGSSYVTLLSVTDANDNTVFVETSEKVRTALRFDSANFTVSYTMEATVVTADGAEEAQTVAGYIDADGVYRTFDSFAEFPLTGSKKTAGADHITFDGVGSGHGVGFSTVGADQLASEGYSYRYLIEFYFPGTKISKAS